MNSFKQFLVTTLAATLIAVAGSAWADKPDHAGGGKGGGKHDKHERHDRDGRNDRDGRHHKHDRDDKHRHDDGRQGSANISFSFGGGDLRVARDYYRADFGSGKCPPGLAKKGNGCQPPGQAKKWAKGRRLGSDIRVYDVPYDLRVRLPAPPPNHKYVRVAGDILLIAVGTSLVVDALENIFGD